MNKTTIELLQQLNTMQSEHIKVLEERIEVISQHRQHLNETISNQAEQLEHLNKTIINQAIEIGEQGEKLDVLKHTIEINNKTIQIQRHDNNLLLQHANNNTNV